MNVHRVAAITLNTTQIPVSNASFDPGFAAFLESNGIWVDPVYVATQAQSPVFSFETPALQTLVGVLGVSPLKVTDTTLYFSVLDDGGVFLTTSAIKIAATDGIAILQGITANGGAQPSPAVARVEVHVTGTGENAPWVVTTGTSTPTVTQLGELFTIGPAEIDSVTYSPTNLDFSANVQLHKEPYAGLPWPGYSGVLKQEPEFRITMSDAASLAIAEEGEAITDTVLWFRKVTLGGSRYGATASQHIKLSAPKAMAYVGQHGGGYPSISSHIVIVKPYRDADNAAIAIAASEAISEA